MATGVYFIQDCDSVPVHHRSTSSCHHGPDPAPGVEQGEFEAGATLRIQVGDVSFLQKSERKVNEEVRDW